MSRFKPIVATTTLVWLLWFAGEAICQNKTNRPINRLVGYGMERQVRNVDELAGPTCGLYAKGGLVIPGVEKMSRGVDITKLDLFPTDLHQGNGFLKPVIEFSYAKAQKWTSPSNGLEYLMPDEVDAVNTIPGGKLTTESQVSGEMDEYKNALSANVGLDISAGSFGSFAASFGYKKLQEQVYKSDRSVAQTSATVSAIQVEFRRARRLTLSEDFRERIEDDLKGNTYSSKPSAYDRFVTDFGTHYFESGMLGGYLCLQSTIENQYVMQSDEQEINTNLDASFFSKVKITNQVDVDDKKVSESFKTNAQIELYYYGGLPVHVSPNDTSFMDTWVPSVIKDPWLFGGKLKPIEDLIQDETVKVEVIKAVQMKRLRAYLQELENAIEFGDFSLGGDDRNKLDEVKQMINSKPDEQEWKIRYLLKVLENMRDRKLLPAYKQKVDQINDKIYGCKNLLKRQCAVSHQREMYQDKDVEFYNARMKMDELVMKLQNRISTDHGEVREWLKKAASAMHYQLSTRVDYCLDDQQCKTCVRQLTERGLQNSCDNNDVQWLIKK